MKANAEYMEASLSEVLISDERLTCPVYCVFKQTGFFAGSAVTPGFASCTDHNRFIVLRSAAVGFSEIKRVFSLENIVKLKISRMLFGQSLIEISFLENGTTTRIKFQVSRKIVGAKFPDQEENYNDLIAVLSQYENA